jgi:hypothetical protein
MKKIETENDITRWQGKVERELMARTLRSPEFLLFEQFE